MTVKHPPAEVETLIKTWGPSRPGLLGWLLTGDHKRIGQLQIITAFVFFLLGGLEALFMRLQLAKPENRLLSADLYNQIFTVHGTTMMFLFAVPIMQGLGIYFVPLMIGSRSTSFPRLNSYGYWVYLLAGIMLYTGFALGAAPDAGWFSYVPLTLSNFSPGKRIDYWAQMVSLTELSSIAQAIVLAVTILRLRAPGMSLNRMPLFVWAMLIQSIMIICAMPWVEMASVLLAADRMISTKFFEVGSNGDAILFQHLFWFFGHPEVYLIFLPALGMVSMIIQALSRRPVYGYLLLVLSLAATGFIGFGLWVHHMFTTGLPRLGQSFFTAASLVIALPTTVQISCWIASLWLGRPRLKLPLLWVLGFFQVLVLGGLTGVMLAVVPFNTQVHDTFFVVAHFHYVLIGGAIFPLFGALYYWFPKLSGRMTDERLGKWNFWTFAIGFNITFFPLHILGFTGMPRRVYTYSAERGWGALNLLATIGACILFFSVCLFLLNVAHSLRRGVVAPDNPWDSDSLEWATASPPPAYNFDQPPIVEGREALWDRSDPMPVVTGIDPQMHEVLVTTVVEGTPSHREHLPGPSPWPVLVALISGSGIWWLIYSPLAFWITFAAIGAGMIAWYYHNARQTGPQKGF